MKQLLILPLMLALATTGYSASAQNTPRSVKKQARADRKMDRAHRVRRNESLTKVPKVVREEDEHDRKDQRQSKRKH